MEKLVTNFCYIFFGSKTLFVISVFFLILLLVFFLARKFRNRDILLFIISVSPAFLFALRLILTDYFLSDDFDHFVISQKFSYYDIFTKGVLADNLWGFHRLFIGFWLFKLVYSVFATNYTAYVFMNLTLHVLNSYLILLLLGNITKNTYVKYLALFIFSSFYLTWISNVHELIAGFWFLLAFISLLRFSLIGKSNTNTFLLISIVSYVLGIYSKEVVFVLPICFILFSLFYKNAVRHIDLKKLKVKLRLFFGIFAVYLIVFIRDFLKFSDFSKGSGYDPIYKLNSVIGHSAFYLTDRIPVFTGILGLTFFILLLIIYDIYKRKPILTPLFTAYVVLLFPVLLLSKSTSYYNYIPHIFLIFIFTYLFDAIYKHIRTKIKSINLLYFVSLIFISVIIVIVFKINLSIQKNCFLIQNPKSYRTWV